MHTEKKSAGLRVGFILLAACMSASVSAMAGANPGQVVGSPGVRTKHSKLAKKEKSKEQKTKSVNVKRKEQASTKVQATKAVTSDSAKQIAQLKQQLSIQQEEIKQLLHAMNKLQAEIEGRHNPTMSASVAEPRRSSKTPPVAQPVSAKDEVASLTPILPPMPKAHEAGENQMLAVNAPANLPKSKQAGTKVLQTGVASRAAVTNSESAPAGQPKNSGLLNLDNGKIRIGTTFFGLYRYYTNTGFGPQILTQINRPGPGNGGFNSFDVNRTYFNFFYSPNDALTFRVTPNLYRQYGGASAERLGKNAATGSTVNGNLVLRVKYAYVDFNKLFSHSKAFGKDKVTFGQMQQPLTDWEEGLYGYRFVNLTPWNYLSLSSTYPGVKIHGPIMFHGKQYLDYDVGVFNNQSFHAYETGEKKQVMARLSYYPMGAISKYQGLGFTGFVDYGYKDAAPDLNVNVPMTRVAALVHYTTKSNNYGIAFEYDYGRNAFSTGHQFSGSAPADEFGLGPTPYANMDALAKALLNVPGAKQRGYDFFGHARLGKTPFYLFGMFEQFDPNTNVSKNPFDFRTVVGGISYKYSKHWEFALDSQNVLYSHGQFTFPASQLALFSSTLADNNPNGISNAVPTDTNAIFFNVLFNY